MARGPKKHLKRLSCPKHWMLDKLGGIFAPKPSPGPHRQRECIPMALVLRNRLKYALTYKEVTAILMNRLVKVDGKVRTDNTFPCGTMDVVDIDRTDEHFRVLYDAKGRFKLHRITREEANFKLCKVRRMQIGPRGVPFITLHDGRTIRYPDPLIKAKDTVMLNLSTNSISSHIKFDVGQLAFVTGGNNTGRIGTITQREKHKGSFEIIYLKDSYGQAFATRATNVFVIGDEQRPLISLPKGKGIRLGIVQEMQQKFAQSPETANA
jgi:small subunit ribosomal protein S4e